MTKDVILSVAKRYSARELVPFVKTLKKSGFLGRVVFFTNGLSCEAERLLRGYGVTSIPFTQEYPYIAGSEKVLQEAFPALHSALPSMIMNAYRFLMYYWYLAVHRGDCERVMFSDVGDVVFQRDPFNFDFQPGVYCFLEDRSWRIRDDTGYTAQWVKNGFGEETFLEIADNHIVCMGVVLASYTPAMDFLKAFIGYCRDSRNDQGILQYLVYHDRLPYIRLIDNESGPVMHLGIKLAQTIGFDFRGRIVNKNKNVVNVLHQYNRHPALVEKYTMPFFLRGALGRGVRRMYRKIMRRPKQWIAVRL